MSKWARGTLYAGTFTVHKQCLRYVHHGLRCVTSIAVVFLRSVETMVVCVRRTHCTISNFAQQDLIYLEVGGWYIPAPVHIPRFQGVEMSLDKLLGYYFHVWKRGPARASKVKAEEYLSLCKSLKNGLNLNREAGSIEQKGHLIPAKGEGKDY